MNDGTRLGRELEELERTDPEVRAAAEKLDQVTYELGAPIRGLIDSLRAALLFHSGSPWDRQKQERWERLTGGRDATTKALCDRIRLALAAAGFEETGP